MSNNSTRLASLETNHTWVTQSLSKIEDTQKAVRTELNNKLDTLTEHVLAASSAANAAASAAAVAAAFAERRK